MLKHKPEHMFGVPTHYQQLASDPKLRDKDLSFIINYAAGGDSLSRGAGADRQRFSGCPRGPVPHCQGLRHD